MLFILLPECYMAIKTNMCLHAIEESYRPYLFQTISKSTKEQGRKPKNPKKE